jgi:hypothetical protein
METTPFFVPAWLVSALALLAAGCIGLLRYMPRSIRLALILPTVYFAAVYLYASLSALGVLQVTIVRIGLLGLFVAEIITASPYLYRLHKAWFSEMAQTIKLAWLIWRGRE